MIKNTESEGAMAQWNIGNYSVLDQPRVLRCLFHPRVENGYRPAQDNREDIMIRVEDGIDVSASFHFVHPIISF